MMGSRILDEGKPFRELSLVGGPLHDLGCRLGLVRAGTDTFPLGLALGAFLWAVLAVLAFAEGMSAQVFSLAVIGGHVRLLVAIPLFFACEALLAPRATSFVNTIVQSGVVPSAALPALEAAIARSARSIKAPLPEAVFLVVALLVSFAGPQLNLPGTSAAHDASLASAEIGWTGHWYWHVCMTVFRFLILRWLWRLAVWSYFLWRLSRMELRLLPAHPDQAGGLGGLETVHVQFAPLILAISAIQSGMYCEELTAGLMSFEQIYAGMALTIIVVAAMFIGPLLLFADKLREARLSGMKEFSTLAAHYVSDFEGKWLRPGGAPRGDLLGTADLQSLADLNNSVGVVRDMRWIPVGPRMLTEYAIAVLIPAMPLLLFKYPLAELAQKFVERLSGF